MPNKKRRSKLKDKMLSKNLGSTSKPEHIKMTLKKLMEKSKIEESDDEQNNESAGILPTTEQPEQLQQQPVSRKKTKDQQATGNLDKKIKKNKYFFLAHPEFKNKVDITSIGENFVVEKEKVEKISGLKTNNSVENGKKKSEKIKPAQKKIGYSTIWTIERCDSSEDEEDDNGTAKKKKKANVDNEEAHKNLKFQKKYETLADGTVVETIDMVKSDESASETESRDDKPVEKKQKKLKSDKKQNVKQSEAEVQLQSSRFRYLNELLYTKPSEDSFEYFKRYESP
jgi:hypothetical protein